MSLGPAIARTAVTLAAVVVLIAIGIEPVRVDLPAAADLRLVDAEDEDIAEIETAAAASVSVNVGNTQKDGG